MEVSESECSAQGVDLPCVGSASGKVSFMSLRFCVSQ